MSESHSFKLAANEWIIRVRWFYIITIVVICSLLRFDQLLSIDWTSLSSIFSYPLASVLLLALLFNALLFSISKMIDLESAHKHANWLSFLQIVGEIAFISLLLYDLPGLERVIPALFFIPIVESIVLFGHYGPLLVSIVIGVVLNSYIVIGNSKYLPKLFSEREQSLSSNPIITWTLLLAVVYLVIGVISTYVAKQISSREKKLEQESSEQLVQLNALKNFNKELEMEERELKAKDYELQMANQKLLQLEEAKSKFVSVTAHQLRTPLSAIKWTFDMMQSGQLGPVNDDQKEFLQKGFDSTQRMIRIVNDLLHVDHMEADKIEFHFAPIALEVLIDTVRFEFENQAKSKQIDVEINKPVKALPLINADETKLRIVLENLIDNAIKYTNKGGNVSITLSDKLLNSARPSVEIIISDSGIGIPEGDKSKIFGKFFRASNAVKQEPDGSGIGLYMSKDIVEKHGGSLSYMAEAKGGTSFHLVLPVNDKN